MYERGVLISSPPRGCNRQPVIFSSWFCYSLSHAECSLLLLLDMFCFSSLRQDGLLLLCE